MGRSLPECLDRAKAIDDIPRILKAFERLRRPRVESIIEMSREMMGLWNLPDGDRQVQRDAFYASLPSQLKGVKPWDGKPVDGPPKGINDPLFSPYFRGHKTVDFVSNPSYLASLQARC